MIDKNKIIENIQKNIALSNFESELNSKEYTHKDYRGIYNMKKMILAATGCSIILLSGIAYAYTSHNNRLKLSANFLKTEDSNYLDKTTETHEDEGSGDKLNTVNGYLIARGIEHYVDKFTNFECEHNGIDICAQRGAKILAVAGGTVKETNYEFKYGNYIIIKHDEEYETLYAYLDEINVKEGDTIIEGQEIGTVGVTGNTLGPHLHLELRHNGVPVNPLDYIDK